MTFTQFVLYITLRINAIDRRQRMMHEVEYRCLLLCPWLIETDIAHWDHLRMDRSLKLFPNERHMGKYHMLIECHTLWIDSRDEQWVLA